MGMGYCANFGYLICLHENNNAEKFGVDDILNADEGDVSYEDYSSAITERIEQKYGVSCNAFYRDTDEGDRYDELEDGWYLEFFESDLYEKKETPAMQALPAKPEFQAWTTFG